MGKHQATVTVDRNAVEIGWGKGVHSSLPHLWLRDNCDCADCRIAQTSEKKFILTSVLSDLEPSEVDFADGRLRIVWPDGHQTRYDGAALRAMCVDDDLDYRPWPKRFIPQSVTYQEFLDDDRVAASAIETFIESGAIILKSAPTTPGALEELAPRLGPIRELLFDRIHDVEVDTAGYNVAHTSMPLPPHNDFASYTWPPSVQALHMLANETTGGESFIVDGWAALASLRDDRPDYFDALCTTPVPFREFDENNETYAVEPIVRCDSKRRIVGIRFSNQLMQALNPNGPGVGQFYRAYHEICRRVSDPCYRSTFRLDGGEILIVSAHRVLHGREEFQADGRRHLQDAYFELDNIRNHLVVLRRNGGI